MCFWWKKNYPRDILNKIFLNGQTLSYSGFKWYWTKKSTAWLYLKILKKCICFAKHECFLFFCLVCLIYCFMRIFKRNFFTTFNHAPSQFFQRISRQALLKWSEARFNKKPFFLFHKLKSQWLVVQLWVKTLNWCIEDIFN